MAKKKQTKTCNLTKSGLRQAENQVLKIIKKLEAKDQIVTNGAIAKLWNNKDRAWIYRTLQSLIEKDYIECYERKYYRIKEK